MGRKKRWLCKINLELSHGGRRVLCRKETGGGEMAKALFNKVYLVHSSERFTAVKVEKISVPVMFACDVLVRIRVNDMYYTSMHSHASFGESSGN